MTGRTATTTTTTEETPTIMTTMSHRRIVTARLPQPADLDPQPTGPATPTIPSPSLADALDRVHGPVLAAAEPEARAWITDCAWGDLDPEDVERLPRLAVWRGIHRHYHGGIDGFLADSRAVWQDAVR